MKHGTMVVTFDYVETDDDFEAGDIVTYDDGIRAVVMDKVGETLYLFNENGCIEKAKKDYVYTTDMATDMVHALELLLQEVEE